MYIYLKYLALKYQIKRTWIYVSTQCREVMTIRALVCSRQIGPGAIALAVPDYTFNAHCGHKRAAVYIKMWAFTLPLTVNTPQAEPLESRHSVIIKVDPLSLPPKCHLPQEEEETTEDWKTLKLWGSNKATKQESHSIWEKSYSETDVQRPRIQSQVYLPGSATKKGVAKSKSLDPISSSTKWGGARQTLMHPPTSASILSRVNLAGLMLL